MHVVIKSSKREIRKQIKEDMERVKQETHYERPARRGPNSLNGKQLRVTHYERPGRQSTA